MIPVCFEKEAASYCIIQLFSLLPLWKTSSSMALARVLDSSLVNGEEQVTEHLACLLTASLASGGGLSRLTATNLHPDPGAAIWCL